MDTINVTVTYKASQECQKALILKGLSGKHDQEIVIAMPQSALVELPISIDIQGKALLRLTERHYRHYDNGIYDMTCSSGFECDCCGRIIDHDYVTSPIYTYGDVLALVTSNNARLNTIDNKIEQDKKQKQLIAEIKATTRQELEKEFSAKYGNTLDQLSQVRQAIANKKRVRTSQIENIIK